MSQSLRCVFRLSWGGRLIFHKNDRLRAGWNEGSGVAQVRVAFDERQQTPIKQDASGWTRSGNLRSRFQSRVQSIKSRQHQGTSVWDGLHAQASPGEQCQRAFRANQQARQVDLASPAETIKAITQHAPAASLVLFYQFFVLLPQNLQRLHDVSEVAETALFKHGPERLRLGDSDFTVVQNQSQLLHVILQ